MPMCKSLCWLLFYIQILGTNVFTKFWLAVSTRGVLIGGNPERKQSDEEQKISIKIYAQRVKDLSDLNSSNKVCRGQKGSNGQCQIVFDTIYAN